MSVGATKSLSPSGIRTWSAISALALLSGCRVLWATLGGGWGRCAGLCMGLVFLSGCVESQPLTEGPFEVSFGVRGTEDFVNLRGHDHLRAYRVYICNDGVTDAVTDLEIAAEVYHKGGPEFFVSAYVSGEFHRYDERILGDMKVRSTRIRINDYGESCQNGVYLMIGTREPLFDTMGVLWVANLYVMSDTEYPMVTVDEIVEVDPDPTRSR